VPRESRASGPDLPDAGADRVKALTAPVKIGVAQSGTEIARKIRDAADTVALGPVDA